jgi:hypothetical protein
VKPSRSSLHLLSCTVGPGDVTSMARQSKPSNYPGQGAPATSDESRERELNRQRVCVCGFCRAVLGSDEIFPLQRRYW